MLLVITFGLMKSEKTTEQFKMQEHLVIHFVSSKLFSF